MVKRYKRTFKFFNTEDQARIFCDKENKSYYIRKNHTASYTPWKSKDGKESKFIAWYATK